MSDRGWIDETAEWLNYVRPEGLVLGPNVLRDQMLLPERQYASDTEEAAEALGLDAVAVREDDPNFVLSDPWRFFSEVLGWRRDRVAGSPGGPPKPPGLDFLLPEQETILSADWVVLGKPEAEADVPSAQAFVMLHSDTDADAHDMLPGWPASAHQRLERLVRESGVEIGVLVARGELRLLYAPHGETAGWMSFPLAPLGRVDGRPMLAGLKVALGAARFFFGPSDKRLSALLKESRRAQNEVSERLSGQVLGALHELLRGLHQADRDRIERLAEQQPGHLYEGLLTCLMRLVFLLYAEDRDLLPTSRDSRAKALYESGYSVGALYQRLTDNAAVNPDTMGQRRGAWGQLLALFRLVHGGHGDWIRGRGGKLFDPDAFPFLEGRDPGEPVSIKPVSDEMVLAILHELMTVEGRALSGEKVRERLSYKALDVEQIGSVYETAMGFAAARAAERMIAVRDEKGLPTFIGIESLIAENPANRQKWLKAHVVKLSSKQMAAVKAADDEASLIEGLGRAVDERASPRAAPIPPGSPYLQPTEERRRSGSHYTPRELTGPIVEYALKPAFDRLGEDATPDEVLALKVCDPACGSGAFLVEACRQIGARLQHAWEKHPALKPARIPEDEDETLHARRLVAQRCLYGVDRNPMAVDLARLSLWLATLARDHEFTFLDHALKSGDSLVGLTRRQIAAVNWDESAQGLPLFRRFVAEEIERAGVGREAIRTAPDDVLRTVQEVRHRNVENEVEPLRQMGDAVIAAFFEADRQRARETARSEVESWVTAQLRPEWCRIQEKATGFRNQMGWHPFHWEIEFPEVFGRDNPGFDSIIGNPPFAGKNTISAANGLRYLPWLQNLHEGAHGNADLIAHFFRRAFNLLRHGAAFGLIATNTIGQGDTRATGLAAIISAGGTISRAVKRLKWPGAAAVVVSVVHVVKGEAHRPMLNEQTVERISAYLVPGDYNGNPTQLVANENKAFQGSILLGMGFTFDDVAAEKGNAGTLAEMEDLIASNPHNAERIKPYIGGVEANNSPTHAYHRHSIDFANFPLRREPTFRSWFDWSEERQRRGLREGIVPDDYPEAVAGDWPDLLRIVSERVKPGRLEQKDDTGQRYWWHFLRSRPALYRAIGQLDNVLVTNCGAAPHLAFALLPADLIYANTLAVFAYPNLAPFAVLQCRVHEIWARFFSSSMKDDLRYAPSDCFETFPFPEGYETDGSLEAAGKTYHDHRAELMIAADEGMTKTYNRFHKASEMLEPIVRLRELHDAMDRAVLTAYGWDDLAASADPEFLDETNENDHTYQNRYFWPSDFRDEVLARLLDLNARRYAEEVRAGLHDRKGSRPASDFDDKNM